MITDEILLVLLISVIASANDVDLASNQNILLILLLVLSIANGTCGCNGTTSTLTF